MTYLEGIARELQAELREGDERRDLFLIYALLVQARGVLTTRGDVHDAWVAWMAIRGESHRSMVPFERLSDDVQAEDQPFVDAIHRVSARHSGRGS